MRWSQARSSLDARSGACGISRRRFVTTTVKGGGRQADITYCPTWSGFLYPAVVLDDFSRRSVGWSMVPPCVPRSFWMLTNVA